MSLEQLLDVTIIGASKYEQKQDEVAAAVSVITRSEIKAFGWRTLDEALASLPGIHTTYDRQYNYLGTRGFGLPGDFNTRVLLTINGNRVNDVVYDAAISGRAFPLDLDLIERIEFIPGPGGAVYGQNALFGVVNVVTRSGAGVDGAELAVAYQSPQSAREGRATWGKTLDNGAGCAGVRLRLQGRAAKICSSNIPGPSGDPYSPTKRRGARHGWRKGQGILTPAWHAVPGRSISPTAIAARTTPPQRIFATRWCPGSTSATATC